MALAHTLDAALVMPMPFKVAEARRTTNSKDADLAECKSLHPYFWPATLQLDFLDVLASLLVLPSNGLLQTAPPQRGHTALHRQLDRQPATPRPEHQQYLSKTISEPTHAANEQAIKESERESDHQKDTCLSNSLDCNYRQELLTKVPFHTWIEAQDASWYLECTDCNCSDSKAVAHSSLATPAAETPTANDSLLARMRMCRLCVSDVLYKCCSPGLLVYSCRVGGVDSAGNFPSSVLRACSYIVCRSGAVAGSSLFALAVLQEQEGAKSFGPLASSHSPAHSLVCSPSSAALHSSSSFPTGPQNSGKNATAAGLSSWVFRLAEQGRRVAHSNAEHTERSSCNSNNANNSSILNSSSSILSLLQFVSFLRQNWVDVCGRLSRDEQMELLQLRSSDTAPEPASGTTEELDRMGKHRREIDKNNGEDSSGSCNTTSAKKKTESAKGQQRPQLEQGQAGGDKEPSQALGKENHLFASSDSPLAAARANSPDRDGQEIQIGSEGTVQQQEGNPTCGSHGSMGNDISKSWSRNESTKKWPSVAGEEVESKNISKPMANDGENKSISLEALLITKRDQIISSIFKNGKLADLTVMTFRIIKQHEPINQYLRSLPSLAAVEGAFEKTVLEHL
eukprot:GHVT01098633.1.p1 GENE.GHVT01098633.1~~GHVT01098633.1.p1  ORF type:complete len:726 (-),score=120.81 GHVT01098633.1:388-2262(-)